ncbi:hypothetical protein TFLX_01789 [Thermoflexales bacterium]|nr:hypothetical protein TFLX_01789 [Thermoflexales bacterium]
MKGDFTRITFNSSKHFSRVLMQQGRVQLDADWNEQAAILLHYLQALAADLIGPFGGPDPGCGFALTAQDTDFTIGPGHYYVDGLLCEVDRDKWSFFKQPDYPVSPDDKLPTTTLLAYLDVWERHLTALEENDIREVALGGPDTTTRAKVVWQIKVTDKQPDGRGGLGDLSRDEILRLWPNWPQAWDAQAACRLKVRLQPDQTSTDPCILPPTSAYRGPENQLYRVEIHAGGTLADDEPTFKWSRDNGSQVAAWLGNNEAGGLIVSNAYGFAAGQWIEITSDADDLLGRPGKFNQIVKVEGAALQLASAETFDEKVPRKIRRWDQQETEDLQLQAGVVPIAEGTTATDWIDLENGIQIQFQPDGSYRPGDYWLIPARATSGAIEWAGDPDNPDALPPFGIEHHYAPLWIVGVAADGKVTLDPKNDLRRKFNAIQ